MLAEAKNRISAIISGRRNFDDAEGWHGKTPDTDIIFITEGGIQAAIAKAKQIPGPQKTS